MTGGQGASGLRGWRVSLWGPGGSNATVPAPVPALSGTLRKPPFQVKSKEDVFFTCSFSMRKGFLKEDFRGNFLESLKAVCYHSGLPLHIGGSAVGTVPGPFRVPPGSVAACFYLTEIGGVKTLLSVFIQ